MLAYAAFLFLLASSSALSVGRDERIVNGTDAKPGEIPYIVSIRKPSRHACGGSILDELHILTAAHCVRIAKPHFVTIQYGTTTISNDNFQTVGAKEIYVHEDYVPTTGLANDIAIIKLNKSLEFGSNVQPIVLPEQDEDPPANEWAVLAGWGYPYSGGSVMENLQHVDLLVYSDDDCAAAHDSTVSYLYHVCSGVPEGGKGQCSTDSGGPLVAEGKQIGIVSWSKKPCAIKGKPGVYTRVARYVDWIRKIISL